MKSWSYKQITENTEQQIKWFMEQARNTTPEPDRGNFNKWMWRSWAQGALASWERLTCGWQKEFDSERMQALAIDESGIDVLIDDGHVHTKPDPFCKKCIGIGSYVEGDEYKNCECCT